MTPATSKILAAGQFIRVGTSFAYFNNSLTELDPDADKQNITLQKRYEEQGK